MGFAGVEKSGFSGGILPGKGRRSNSSGGIWVVESEMELEFGAGDSIRGVAPR